MLEVRVPYNLCFRSRVAHYSEYFEGTLQQAATEGILKFREDRNLGFPTPLSFEFSVDGEKAAIDVNDMPQLPPIAGNYLHWWKFHTNSSHVPFTHVHSFPPTSFLEWGAYIKFGNLKYTAESDTVLHAQRLTITIRDPKWTQDLTRRRTFAREMLQAGLGSSLDSKVTHQHEFWERASKSLVSVHIPGMWNNMLDRGQHQLWGLGICTISPYLVTTVLREQPIPGVHYLQCRDDLADLLDVVQWCKSHRETCVQIGENARAFFDRNSTPKAIWTHIHKVMCAAKTTQRKPAKSIETR